MNPDGVPESSGGRPLPPPVSADCLQKLDSLELRYQELAQHVADAGNNHLLEYCKSMLVAATVLLGFVAASARNWAGSQANAVSGVSRVLQVAAWVLATGSLVSGMAYMLSAARFASGEVKALCESAATIHQIRTPEQIRLYSDWVDKGHPTTQSSEHGDWLLSAQGVLFILALICFFFAMLY
jgi:uncharacterized membrane-anchored protein YhcB (DUF1043 family)